jgi:uncharacterized SAM-binding protein YcdF (DUF218 family)
LIFFHGSVFSVIFSDFLGLIGLSVCLLIFIGNFHMKPLIMRYLLLFRNTVIIVFKSFFFLKIYLINFFLFFKNHFRYYHIKKLKKINLKKNQILNGSRTSLPTNLLCQIQQWIEPLFAFKNSVVCYTNLFKPLFFKIHAPHKLWF